MTVGPAGSGFNIIPVPPLPAPRATEPATGFSERLKGALSQLQASQTQAAQSAQAWELGLQQDLAAVMIDQQVASLGFQLTLNVRNKALGAYRDIMNMPL